MEDFYIHPMVEWNWRLPVNRQGYDCVFVPDRTAPAVPRRATTAASRPGHQLLPHDALGRRARAAAGARPGVTVAADIGLTGVNTLVRELAPTQPYNILIGASYAYDTTPPAPEIREVEVEREVQVGPRRAAASRAWPWSRAAARRSRAPSCASPVAPRPRCWQVPTARS
jgi:hypothetical protein